MADKAHEPAYRVKVGDPVFIRGNRRDRDVTVTKVGRTKYHLSGGMEPIDIAPLSVPDEGARHMEFNRTAWLSMQALADASEKTALVARVRAIVTTFGPVRLTVDQCRRIVAIIAETP